MIQVYDNGRCNQIGYSRSVGVFSLWLCAATKCRAARSVQPVATLQGGGYHLAVERLHRSCSPTVGATKLGDFRSAGVFSLWLCAATKCRAARSVQPVATLQGGGYHLAVGRLHRSCSPTILCSPTGTLQGGRYQPALRG